MNAFLLIPFLVACAAGGVAAWHVPLERASAFAVLILIIAMAAIAGMVTVAAEAGSAEARYLGLAGLLLVSAALSGIVIAARRRDRAQRPPDRA